MSELSILQAVRFKGRCTAEAAAAVAGVSPSEASQRLEQLAGSALVSGAVNSAFRITAEGKQRVAELIAAEAAEVDGNALAAEYSSFDEYNSEFKAIITAWQMKDPETPNDHLDQEYDEQVVHRLGELHTRFAPLLNGIVALADRLKPYPGRFENALDRIVSGDHTFIARPLIDSYHTVWFELHEELIGLLGRTRAEEAAAGRAI
ncbi:hypothetical protein [Sciscionella marina]|uniref:hypothetical protein n=1 Tax=Sciscionella marina TaxID=508770 RepID=UPI00036C5474|nr:hypothetical protein [Sciscionella marina]